MVPCDYAKPSIKASDRSQHLETKIQDILALNYIVHWLILSPTPCRCSNYHWRLLAIVTFLPFESNLFGLDIFSRADQAKQDSMESPVVGSKWCKCAELTSYIPALFLCFEKLTTRGRMSHFVKNKTTTIFSLCSWSVQTDTDTHPKQPGQAVGSP